MCVRMQFMPTRKVVLYFGILIFLLTGSGLGLFSISQAEAASPAHHLAPNTQTPAPKSTPNSGATAFPATTQFVTYTIQTGDTIYLIAQKMYGQGSKYSLILSANNINENTRLLPGTILKIPVLPVSTSPTLLPTLTATLVLPSVTPTIVPSPTQPVSTQPLSNEFEGPIAIIKMLTVFATSTLAVSLVVCLFLAFVVYSSSRRIARKQRMARRVRPLLVR